MVNAMDRGRSPGSDPLRHHIAMNSDDNAVRAFLRLLYATFERSPTVFSTSPNFYGARHLVTTLLTLNLFALLILGMRVSHLPLPGRNEVVAWLAIVAPMALFGMWLTSGLDDSEETTALRDAIDCESARDGWIRRSKVAAYVIVSIVSFLCVLST